MELFTKSPEELTVGETIVVTGAIVLVASAASMLVAGACVAVIDWSERRSIKKFNERNNK